METYAQFPDLQRAVSAARCKVLGTQDVQDSAHARIMAGLLRAFGDDENAMMYAEPTLSTTNTAPDLILAHPALGILVVEVKAYDLDFIIGLEAGNLRIRRNGSEQAVNPLKQAQRGMYALKEAYEQRALDTARPLFNAMVALPNIGEQAWTKSGYEAGLPRRLVLFAEDCDKPERLRERIMRHVHQTLVLSGLPVAWPTAARDTLVSAFGGVAALAKPIPEPRRLPFEKMGAEIDRLEAAHKTLSLEQQELARVDNWGHPYLLRGVAGSGKSVVLAYQVAWAVLRHERRHQQLTLFAEDRHPMPKIAVVCLQRTLVPFLEQAIHEAYRVIAGVAMPEGVVKVSHLNGLLYDLAEKHDHFHYLPMTGSKDPGERSRAYLAQLDSMTAPELDELRCDAMYIDEGQDLHPDTLTLLYTLVRPDSITTERTLSIYYDDAQNMYGHPRPTWRTFGLNVEGGRTDFMRQCYRNSREIIELALNVLLGTAADEKTRVQTRRFADIYTLKEKGLVDETPQGWRASYAETHGDSPQVQIFPNRPAQVEWVAEMAVSLIETEKIRPENILILADTTGPFPHLERKILALAEGRIKPRIIGGNHRSTLDEMLILPDLLTFSTIHAAKGYDAPFVILMDADRLSGSPTGRAAFYVAATRAKRYLVIAGVKTPDSLLSEAQTMHKRLFGG